LPIFPTLTRRSVLIAPLAAGIAACSSTPQGRPADHAFQNLETLSESVHSGVASRDGQYRLTVRLCRYPDLGLSWIWIHARTPAGFFSYVDHLAPCGKAPIAADRDAARYADAADRIVFQRTGPVTMPVSVTVTGHGLAHRTNQSRFGDGAHPLEFSIRFSPERLYAGLLPGRTEVFGHTQANIIINGESFDIEGPAQFHEQRQTTPRFTQAFSYGTLWGETVDATCLLTAKRQEGYLLGDGDPQDIHGISLGRPADLRTLAVRVASGDWLAGEVRQVQGYTIPIIGQLWQGHMVNVDLGGRQYFGHVNDFMPAGVPYAA
jgi:hypothetical protein